MADDDKVEPEESEEAQKLFNTTRLDTEAKAAKMDELQRRSRESEERDKPKDREDR